MDEVPNRLNLEWLFISALREALSLIQESYHQNYNDTIRFAQENFGELFQNEKSIFGGEKTLSKEYEKYRQETKAKSYQEKKEISTEDLINERINVLSKLIDSSDNVIEDLDKLKGERKSLRKLLENENPKFIRIDENEALRNDFSPDRPGLEYQSKHAGKSNIYKTRKGEMFILRFLHPGKAEAATGVDLIYEIYNANSKLIRIIALQYKIWEDDVFYFSNSHNIQKQLDKSKACFCLNEFCKAGEISGIDYRLPHCIPFLRLTDKIYDINKLISSGWHIPVCQISKCVEYSQSENQIIRLDNIKNKALNSEEFESLFQYEKLGSRWLTIKETEEFYKDRKIINNDENIIIYSQKSILQ